MRRAVVVLATAEGCGKNDIMCCSGLFKPVDWRWQERFMYARADGLLKDKTPQARQALAETLQRVLDLTLCKRTASFRYSSNVNVHQSSFIITLTNFRVLGNK